MPSKRVAFRGRRRWVSGNAHNGEPNGRAPEFAVARTLGGYQRVGERADARLLLGMLAACLGARRLLPLSTNGEAQAGLLFDQSTFEAVRHFKRERIKSTSRRK